MPSNKKIEYQVLKRNIKYPRLEFKTGELIVIIPHVGNFDVPKFIDKYQKWINDKNFSIKKYNRKKVELRKVSLDKAELRHFIDEIVTKNVEVTGFAPRRIIIRRMRSKWGSCSTAKNLCFNSLLCKLPDNLIEYVVFHEMCHLRQRKHDGNFKAILKKRYSNPEKMEKKLFSYWFAITTQIPAPQSRRRSRA